MMRSNHGRDVAADEGTLRVLRAAREAGARRVVLTSGFAAVGYSPKPVRDYTHHRAAPR